MSSSNSQNIQDKKSGFKKLKKKLSEFVTDMVTQEVATITDDSLSAYTKISLDGDTLSFINNELKSNELLSIEMHKYMIEVSRASKNAFGEMLNEIT